MAERLHTRLTLRSAIILMACCSLLVGCGGDVATRLPNDPEQLILYSIDGPSWHKNDTVLTPDQNKGEILHGVPVLGKVEIRDPDQRRAVITAIKDAARENPMMAACFIPRHAIRTVRSGETIEVLICFQCKNYQGYRQGKFDTKPISSAPEALLDKLLSDAKVPLASKKTVPD